MELITGNAPRLPGAVEFAGRDGFDAAGLSISRVVIGSIGLVLALLQSAVGDAAARTTDQDAATRSNPEAVAFFEREIRPLLADRCWSCHSARASKVKGGLRLDTRADVLRGGDTGPAMVPGDPPRSLLIEAVSYQRTDLQMPPKGRLEEKQIAALKTWIAAGAPWPDGPSGGGPSSEKRFELAKRKASHWCWQPIVRPPVPSVRRSSWVRQPIDAFLLASLEAHGMAPAPEADRRTLVRRVYFDLIGLPPTPGEVRAFVEDHSPNAWEKLADRLLGSPRFGERWARHWMDLVRYAETLGHEFDYPRENAWRYRDYLIRAFNRDVPYDQLAREHLAGDLLPEPRLDPDTGWNESIIGTGFWWFGQQSHSPVDVRQNQADVIDNQIDVMSKTFLGVTVACARCHDHKFDAISTRDFYSLYGVISSSRYAQRPINRAVGEPRLLEASVRSWAGAQPAVTGLLETEAHGVAAYLETAARAAHDGLDPTQTAVLAAGTGLRTNVVQDLAARLRDGAASAEDQPFRDLARWAQHRPVAGDVVPAVGGATNAAMVGVQWDFSHGPPVDWLIDGPAFQDSAVVAGLPLSGDESHPVGGWTSEPGAHSGKNGLRLQGALRSPTFTIDRRYLHLRLAGRASRVNVVIANFMLIRDPIYGSLKVRISGDVPRWRTVDLERWRGLKAYVEILDETAPDPTDDGGGMDEKGWAFVGGVVTSDSPEAPAWRTGVEVPAVGSSAVVSGSGETDSPAAISRRYESVLVKALGSWGREGALDPAGAGMLATLWSSGFFVPESAAVAQGEQPPSLLLRAWYDARKALEQSIPTPIYVHAICDGNASDEPVFIRGNYHTLGPVTPRRAIEALGGRDDAPFGQGSGRLELANVVVAPENPLFARVFVNRLWLHLFGQGLVPTPDDLGVLGQPPTQRALLDWLADYARREGGYSVKRVLRMLVTSSAYRMSSDLDDSASEALDPTNQMFHRANLRRLEGEALRDAVLLISGRLDPTGFGPSVPTHLTDFMDGRGRPGRSGPADGAGRRSVYLEVRSNFLVPMFRAFDTPIPFTTVGRRSNSNVPAQALIFLNDPMVIQQAGLWATNLVRAHPLRADRLESAYLQAYGRRPTSEEARLAERFLAWRAGSAGTRVAVAVAGAGAGAGMGAGGSEEIAAWSDLCHVLLNTKEFLYLR